MANEDALNMLRLAKSTVLDDGEATYGLIDDALSILEAEGTPALWMAQAGFDAARTAYYSAEAALCHAAEAWIKAKVLSLHPTAVTLVMRGEAGEEFNATWRAAYVLNDEGGILADLSDRDEDNPDDGPTAWSEVTDLLPELSGPDGYMGDTRIDLTS